VVGTVASAGIAVEAVSVLAEEHPVSASANTATTCRLRRHLLVVEVGRFVLVIIATSFPT